jgi:Family of unknown function (DUF6502)
MSNQPTLALDRVLRVLRPLVRLLLANGVTYPVLAAALKRVFLDAARQELGQRGMSPNDSAVSLLSGVHRRDVRMLSEPTDPHSDRDLDRDASTSAAPAAPGLNPKLGLAAQVVAQWMHAPAFVDGKRQPRALQRGGGLHKGVSFDSLVASVSSDVRPRAVLDELLRLGVVHEDAQGIHLAGDGFAPRQGFEEMSALFAANLSDHAAAAAANLRGEGNFLEQAVFVDQISADSAARLQKVSVQAWRQAFKTVMAQAQKRFDDDAALPAEQHQHRARFGVYFYSERQE